jgi:transposase
MQIIYPYCAAIDVHKKQITVAVRTPGQAPGQRDQEVRKYPTFYSALRTMAVWLVDQQVTHVAMEATGIYWLPVFHALQEAKHLEVILCNAAHVTNVPGRTTDAADAAWLAKLGEVGLLRPASSPHPRSPHCVS